IAKDPDSRQFRQKSGPGGCVSETDGSCNVGRGLTGAASVATDPSGEFIYVGGDHTIAVFKRSSGGLTQLSGTAACVNDTGSDGCTNGYVPGNVTELASDGHFLYGVVSAPGEGAILAFSKNPQGVLTQLPLPAGCINNDGA